MLSGRPGVLAEAVPVFLFWDFVLSKRSLVTVSKMKRTREGKSVLPRTNAELFDHVKAEYYFENGLRKVHPYYFEYQTYAKQRWLGRSVLDVFLREFRDRPARYYREAIERQLIQINGEPCTLEKLVECSDLIAHRIHRHEPPVSGEDIQIIHEGGGMLVVNKPASIPVHPSGRYRFNTLVEILRHQLRYDHLSVINRLDRLTSGICILATNVVAAERLHQQIEARQLIKVYVARVEGEFPESVVCEEPLLVVEHKLGLVTVDRERGKSSRTTFERMAAIKLEDGTIESIVRCKPETGRTHQIRVHLQSLGYPIVNDVLYNNPIWADTTDIRQIAKHLMDETADEQPIINELPDNEDGSILCPECQVAREDPRTDQLCIYLHALCYSSSDWSFETELPFWAKPDQ